MPWGSPEDLLARLDAFLAVESDDGGDDPLRDPWRSLEHQRSAPRAVRRAQLGDLEDLAGAEDRVRTDYRARFAIELLQNAHDACADDGSVGRAWIHVTDSALLIGNEGAPFDARRLGSLLRLGGSSKEAGAGHHTIGYKGIGFSSVFEITDEPQVISGTYRFGFHRGATEHRVQDALGMKPRGVPVRRFPFPLADSDWSEDAEAVEAILERGAVTVVRLPFRDDMNPDQVRADVMSSLPPEVLLFMPALNGLSFLGDEEVSWTRRSSRKRGLGTVEHLDGPDPRSWLTVLDTVEVGPQLTGALRDAMWSGVTQLGVGIAIPWRGRRPDPTRGAQPIHVYFPTEDQIGRSFLVHGDFYVDSSRRHVEAQNGAGRALNERVAEAIAELVAKTAVGLVQHGNSLLRVLAPSPGSHPSGFGDMLCEGIDARLAEASICRVADGGDPRRPSDSKLLVTELGSLDEERLMGLLSERGDLLPVGDRSGVEAYLKALGSEELTPVATARRLDPRQASASYEQALTTVRRWYEALPTRSRVVAEALRAGALVQDEKGKWRRPEEVVLSAKKVPVLPGPVRPRTLQAPRGVDARAFVVDVLGVEELTPEGAVSRLVDALISGDFGSTDKQRRDALAFLFRVWRAFPHAIGPESRLEVVRVPVRSGDSHRATDWIDAGDAYFGRSHVPEGVAEDIYGPLGQAEFLVWDMPDKHRSDWVHFFRVLGVADTPRLVPLPEWPDPSWRALPEVKDAWACPDGHPQSPRRCEGVVLDRLKSLLASESPVALRRLAGYLASLPKPHGEAIRIRCAHSSHPGTKNTGRMAPGYQDWLLRSMDWIPVEGEPERFVSIERAWFRTQDPVRSVLPHADLTDRVASALGCVAGTSPSRRAVELAMADLASEYDDLGAAPSEVRDVANWLLARLDGHITGSVEQRPTAGVVLPSRSADDWVWSAAPVISDLPGLSALSIERLDEGRGRGLRERYGLKLASEVVAVEAAPMPLSSPSESVGLSAGTREAVVALLHAQGCDLKRTAGRIGRMVQVPCRSLELVLTNDEISARASRGHYLERTVHRGTRSARLYLVSGAADPHSLAVDLARYLDADEHSPDLALLFLDLAGCLRHRNIGEQELLAARAALARYPNDVEDLEELDLGTQPDESDAPVQNEPADEHPGPTPAVGDSDLDPDLDFATPWGEELASPSPSAPVARGGSSSTSPFVPVDALAPVDTGKLTFGPWTERGGSSRQGRKGETGSARAVSASSGSQRRRSGAERDHTEETAIAVFTHWAEKQHGAAVQRVDHLNLGWDLEVRLNEDVWPVEVKGMSGNGTTIIVTPNELDAARTTPEYRIAVVTGTDFGRGKIALIANLDTQIEPDDLRPMSWAIEEWETLEHEGAPWTEG
jgi:hypothetical protein